MRSGTRCWSLLAGRFPPPLRDRLPGHSPRRLHRADDPAPGRRRTPLTSAQAAPDVHRQAGLERSCPGRRTPHRRALQSPIGCVLVGAGMTRPLIICAGDWTRGSGDGGLVPPAGKSPSAHDAERQPGGSEVRIRPLSPHRVRSGAVAPPLPPTITIAIAAGHKSEPLLHNGIQPCGVGSGSTTRRWRCRRSRRWWGRVGPQAVRNRSERESILGASGRWSRPLPARPVRSIRWLWMVARA